MTYAAQACEPPTSFWQWRKIDNTNPCRDDGAGLLRPAKGQKASPGSPEMFSGSLEQTPHLSENARRLLITRVNGTIADCGLSLEERAARTLLAAFPSPDPFSKAVGKAS